MFFPALFVASVALGDQGATAEAPRQPTENWVAEYADDMCLLQRNYGSAEAPLILAFRPQPMSDYLTTYVFESGPRKKVGWATAEVRLGAGSPPIEKTAATYYAPKLKSRVAELGFKREELEKAAVTGAISFDIEERLEAAFQVPDLAKALLVLDDCVADLLASWGFSREQQAAMASKPQPEKPLSKYVDATDYPTVALRQLESGWNSARYRIDAKGRVSDCQVVESSGSKSLDATICRVVGRYRYRPAIDRSGQPMESLGFVRIRWQVA